MEMTSLVTKLFGPPEEIAGFTTHLDRWKILGSKRLKVYLQHSCGTDWSGDIGTYPKRFLAVGFAESNLDESAAQLELFSERAAWTVLIGSYSGRRENRAAH